MTNSEKITAVMLITTMLLSIIAIMLIITVETNRNNDTASTPEIVSETASEVETPSLPEEETETVIYKVEKVHTFYDVPFEFDIQKKIIEICSEYDIDYELILAMMYVESTYRADVIGDGGESFGLMQIQPKWWGELMYREGIADLLDPLQNIRCGCAIMRDLKRAYRTEYRALQAYNTGNPNSNNGYAERVYEALDDLTVSGYSYKLVEKEKNNI